MDDLDLEREDLHMRFDMLKDMIDYLESKAPQVGKWMRNFFDRQIKHICQKYETEEKSWEDEYEEWKL